MECAKLIAGFLSGLLTPVIGILAAYIAWQQHRTAREKLKLDLYDRRFRVYRGLTSLLASIIETQTASHESLGNYYLETNEKLFLFDRDIIDYMQEVRKKAVAMRQLQTRLEESPSLSDDERRPLIDDRVALSTWFEQQVHEAPRKFERYLAFKRNL